MELVTAPMDLGTIKEKLRSLEYPDMDSFVADVRLVFSNSDKYNLVCNQLPPPPCKKIKLETVLIK